MISSRICLIATSLDFLGGLGVQVNTIYEGFRKEGVEIDCLYANPKLKGIFGICQRYKFIRTIVTSVAYVIILFKQIPKYDVLHIFSASHFSFLLASMPAILIGKYFKKKVVLNYHSGEAEDHLSRSESTIKRVLKYVDVVVVPSVYLQKIFCKFGIESEVIYNIINEEDFPFKKREIFKPCFIVSRNLEPMYNVACVLKAFKLIQDKYPEAELTVIGYGSQDDSLKSLSKDLNLNYVVFAGRVERDAIAKYYQKADFMLNASNIDNMPISILEAFSSGIPVISSEAGGIPYIIKDGKNGLLVPLNDEKSMAEKAIYLLSNQDIAGDFADNASKECRISYSWEANRKAWLELYCI